MKISLNSYKFDKKVSTIIPNNKQRPKSGREKKYIDLFNLPNAYYNKVSIGYVRSGVSFSMKEDIFAKSRNGHLLIDTYDKNTNSLDIRSNGLYPANVISNLAHNEFCFDDVKCASLEGFLQSLKTHDKEKQVNICSLYGGSAKKISKKFDDWKQRGTLFWKEREYSRISEDYKDLLLSAYKACYSQNETFRDALNSTIGKNLTHSDGKIDPFDTILTRDEFIEILNQIRGS